ncbi:protein trunk [Lutzomyia longipalpis]|uniref:Uncharacterized protein n=1 Tax=Lutzomyia longipalpis TaxID=7200 RepID=A0A1B0EY62_LUTLO|nr:protein trunk [Lutzomyia longipalpis]
MHTMWMFGVLLFVGVLGVKEEPCGQVSTYVLMEILGPAYNYRYMRLDTPSDGEEDVEVALKRDTMKDLGSFYVADGFVLELDDEPAWTRTPSKFIPAAERIRRSSDEDPEDRTKRAIDRPNWSCEAHIRWQDLGPDYFPRYLRSVECVQAHCYYGHYDCRPRFFSVRLLRRRKGECAALKMDSVDLWVWEERAVAMCCDCVYRQRA